MSVKYERVMNSLFGRIEDNFEGRFSSVVNNVEKEVNKAHRKFFRKLVMKAIDVRSAPELGEYTPAWKPLGPKYVKEKKRKGYSKNFYMKTGELKTALNSLDPVTVLGTPLVAFRPAGLSGRSGVSTRYEVWNGASSKRRVIRDERGRFAKVADIPRYLSASFIVNPYPKILDDLKSSVIDESDYLEEDIAEKLKNPRRQRLRPILQNFLNWYLDTEIKAAMKKGITNG